MSEIRRRLMYAKPKEVPNYLCFTALEDGVFTLTIGKDVRTIELGKVAYSIDEGDTWVETTNVNNQEVIVTTPTITNGSKVLWRGNGPKFSRAYNAVSYRSVFSSSGTFNISGNIMSLLYWNNFDDELTISNSYTFYYTFSNCVGIIDASEMLLPATTLQNGYEYRSLFQGCTGMTHAPKELPCKVLAAQAYMNMFYGCSSLVDTPEFEVTSVSDSSLYAMFYGCASIESISLKLSATTLAKSCYRDMFNGCSLLQTAPELPATELVLNCYVNMFYSCSSLNYIKMGATDITIENNNPMQNWVNGVASDGTFVRNPEATWWVTGASGIPNGWLLEDGTEQDDEIIVFEDPEAKRVITSMYGGIVPDATYSSHWPVRFKGKADGEITYRQASHIATITNAFYNNTELIKFHEFQYFTAIDGRGSQWFRNCKTLQEITLPTKQDLAIAQSAFCQCRDLVVINNWDKVTVLGGSAFLQATDPLMSLFASLDFTNITRWGGSVARENTKITSLYLPNVRDAHDFYSLYNCALIDVGHDNKIEFGTLFFWGWSLNPHECNLVFRCPPQIKTNWSGMNMHQNASGCVFNLYVYEKYYNDYVNDAYWATADNIYKIGGTEWVAQFGSSSEWADYPNGQAPNIDLTESEIEYARPLVNTAFDTGITPTANTHIVVRGRYADLTNTEFAGTFYPTTQRFHMGCYGNKFYFGCGSKYLPTVAWDTNMHTFELYGNGTAVLDGTEYNVGATLGTAQTTISLFARHNNTTTGYAYSTSFELYSAQIYEGTTLIKDYVLYRYRGVIYFKDKVSNNLEWIRYEDNFDIGNDVTN